MRNPAKCARKAASEFLRVSFRLAKFGVRSVLSFFAVLIFVPVGLALVVEQRFSWNRTGKIRVLIGIEDIGLTVSSTQEVLDEASIPTTSVCRPGPTKDSRSFSTLGPKGERYVIQSTYNQSYLRQYANLAAEPFVLGYLFLKFFRQHSVWLFYWNKTFLPLHLDLMLLALARKRVLSFHCGDDSRYRPIQRSIDRSLGFDSWPELGAKGFFVLLKKFIFVAMTERFASVVSMRNQSTFQQKPYFYFHFPQRNLRQTSGPALESSKLPMILHAPSARTVKGTHLVLEAVSLLRDQGLEFDFLLLEGVSNDEVLSALRKSDILVDQPSSWVGRLAVEACASGVAVIGGNRWQYEERTESPIVQFEPSAEALATCLAGLIEDRNFLVDRKRECFDFWNLNYSEAAFLKFFESVLDGSAPRFQPLPNQRVLVLAAATTWVERVFLSAFYHPRQF
jgi:hypothetical protein